MNETLPDIPRLYTALAEWLACFVLVLNVKKRKTGIEFIVITIAALAVQILLFVSTAQTSVFLWLPIMASAVFLMYVYIKSASRLNVSDSIYCGIRAFLFAEFVASLEWQINYFFNPSSTFSGKFSEILLLILTYSVCFTVVFFIEKGRRLNDKPLNINAKELLSPILIGAGAFTVANVSFVSANTPFSGMIGREIMNIRTGIMFIGFALLYAHYYNLREYRTSVELSAANNIIRTQYAQYQISKESIELISRKYHDLKHQILFLRTEGDKRKRNDMLDEMENEIKTFEAQNKTGNPVLDTILTSKILYCTEHGITLTCVVDGELLDFMEVTDICALFGNALDNSIESVEKLHDIERKLIHLTVSRIKGFLSVSVENCYEGELDFEDGLPKTTKSNTNDHGYGMKSILVVARKYGGMLNADTKDGWFILGLLFPLETVK